MAIVWLTLVTNSPDMVQDHALPLDISSSDNLMQFKRNLKTRLLRKAYYMSYYWLYNNQINARALIGQSAVVYCVSKGTHGKIARLLNYYIKAIDHKFLWFIG